MPKQILTDVQLESTACEQGSAPGAGREVLASAISPAAEEITPAILSLIELDQRQIDSIAKMVPGGGCNVQDIYPLSPLQEGMLFHRLLNEQRDTYVLSTAFELRSLAHVQTLIDALQEVIDRHDILRSSILWEGLARPVQVVHRRAELPVEYVALDPQRDQLQQLHERMRPGSQPIDVQRAPLLRLQVAITPDTGKCHAVLLVHHLACDHQSLRMVVSEVLACIDGREHSLPPPVPFREYVAHALERAAADASEAFFRRKLGDIDEPTAPFGLTDLRGDGSHIEEARETLDMALAQRLRAQARRYSVSPARLLHAAWALVVARTSGRDDVVFGTVVLAARQRSSRAQRMLGMSVNTLPLRLRLQERTAQQLVEHTHEELREFLQHESAPLFMAQRCSGLTGTVPLFTSLLNCRHSAPDRQIDRDTAIGVRVLARGEAWTNYPITVTIDDLGDGFVLMAKADRTVGPHRILGYLSTAVESLVTALDRAPECPARLLNVLPSAELHHVIHEFNATRTPYPEEKLIHELFEEQVQRTPEAVAVAHQEQTLTFAELNARANQLARHLRAAGVGPDKRVALCLERSVELLVAVLGVLKAGGAYVPMDPSNPRERLEHLINDAQPRALLTREELKNALPSTSAQVLTLDGDWPQIAAQDASNLERGELHPEHLAYVIYTSGSTGKPKGVMVEHRSIVNYSVHIARQFDIASGEGSLVCTSTSFDLMLTGLYPTLLSGRTVRLCREQQGLPALAEELLHCQNLAPLKLTPSHLTLLEHPLRNGRLVGRVRALVLGGESLQASTVRLWREHAPGTRLFNHYGPTEATVGCVVNEISADVAGIVPIGRPISNTQVYILDHHRQPVPIGVTGEIYVAGAGVARGYLNRPELTAERFLRDPFSTDPRARMYKTGDLGRWRADGLIDYLGRNDQQVKIRGFRIELGEIEAQLLRHEQVRAAVVIAREDVPGEKRLVAYVVPTDLHRPPGVESMRSLLRAALPEYMLPSAYVTIGTVPLTPNGKLDRCALPAPELACTTREYEAPQGEVEEILAGIWQVLLRVERVGRQDNFFELGGHSLLIVQMLDRLRAVGLSTKVRRVFDSPTLADLAGALTREAVAQFEVPPNLIPPDCEEILPEMVTLVDLEPQHIGYIVRSVAGGARNIQDIYPLAPLQEGILFHHLLSERGGDVYVLPTLLSLSSRQRLDDLIAALQQIIDRHDVLRTAILWEDLPRPIQVACRRIALPVKEIALDRDRDALEQVMEWMQPRRQRMDLREAPLMRLQIAASPGGQWYAMLQLHHIVDDATSLEIVISEIVAHLERREQQALECGSYRSHVAQALAYARTHDAEAFFSAKLSDIDEPTAPFGLLDVHGDGTQIAQARRDLELSLARRIRAQARRLAVSAATVFHAAWALVVARTSGRDDVVFGSVLLGRLQGTAGMQRVLGMFINTLPLRVQLRGVAVRELVERTQRDLVELLGHEQASLAVAQRCSGVRGSTPLFNTLLNYRHSARTPDAGWIKADGVKLIARHGFTNYPITLSVDDLTEGFRLTAQSDRRVDPQRLTAYLDTALQSLVEALEQSPQLPALDLPVLPSAERREVIQLLNATQASYRRDVLIHELFEDSVRRQPDAVAVEYEGPSLTYAQLNEQANRLARHLRSRGVGADSLVGLCVERSPQMVIAVLAILKAGGAYVPLDPSYPAERLQYMLADAAPRLVLTQARLRALLPATDAQLVPLDAQLEQLAVESSADLSRSEIGTSPDNLLYVIYTSGSTGRPKGTAMHHRAMTNLMQWHRDAFDAQARPRTLQFAALSFDVAFQEIFSTLCTGGTLILLDEWVRRDPAALMEVLRSRGVERLFVPPLMLQSLAEYFRSTGAAAVHLRDVITAGEQLRISPEIVSLFEHLSGCRLHNHYGPTETHVVTALTLLGSPQDWPALPSIGAPIANTQIYVLDERREPVPRGVIGEIYIGGANVACGYLRRPQLTSERFLLDPFQPDPDARMYKTGDLGCWRPDGTIQYLGRNDDQVKIRGFRVELGEIESQLALHPQVKEAAVVAREDTPGEKRLVAYATLRSKDGATIDELRAHVKVALPEHMVPSAFVILDSMPVTPSGKLNRRALPSPDRTAFVAQQYDPPRGEVEEKLAAIWRELLHIDRIGRDDNIFERGAHSLLVLKAIFMIGTVLDCKLRVIDLYRSPTVAMLAARIGGDAVEDEPIDLTREAVLDERIMPIARVGTQTVRKVLLTGATGFVGRFLLRQLLEDTDATVHCLVRAPSEQQAYARLQSSLMRWDLWREDFERRVVAVPGDLRLPRLGIAELTYRMLCQEVDSIFHCATSMNHLETYEMAKAANVGSAQAVLELATSRRPKLVNYLSTIGVFGATASERTKVVNETTSIEQEKHFNSRGYVASKWVAEKIMMLAAWRGIPCNIFRLGLAWADTRKGRFDELQNVYRMLKSCLLSGYGIEHFRFPVTPAPVDYVARAILYLADRFPDGRGTFHVSSTEEQINGLFESCNEIAGTSLELLSYYEWICEMKRLHHAGWSLPTVPLIEFAFSMDEKAFHEHQRSTRSAANVQFDCTRTHAELAQGGILAPVFNEELLVRCLEGMIENDPELQRMREGAPMLLAREDQSWHATWGRAGS